MNAPAPAAAGSAARCHVRYDLGRADANATDLVAHVQRLVDAWVPAICACLGRLPDAPIIITLRPGAGVARTRGVHVLVPVDASASSPEAALMGANVALAHELVHAVVGRLAHYAMNEGLAVHVDATLRLAGPAWPFGLLAPHRWVAVFRQEGTFLPLATLLAGPPATDRDTRRSAAILRWARYYLEAGSLVGYLIDELGMAPFLASCGSGPPLLDGEEASLEDAWLGAVGDPPTGGEWELVRASATLWATSHRDVPAQADCATPDRGNG